MTIDHELRRQELLSENNSKVVGLEKALGEFYLGTLPTSEARPAPVPVFHQVLDPDSFELAFEPGSKAFEVLSNDQNRFETPRSLPPILALDVPTDEAFRGSLVVTRYAYSEGAFRLLDDLLEGGYVFTMGQFLEFAWSLSSALAFLHHHEIVHGQWNSKSVIVIPAKSEDMEGESGEGHRFELLNTGVFSKGTASMEGQPRDYYPQEVLVTAGGAPDSSAIDARADVYCFSAFLKDLLQRACSSESLPSQASRTVESLQRKSNRKGWKTSPEQLRVKELEILDHLYTIKSKTEAIIQQGLKPREQRASADEIHRMTSEVHEKAALYEQELDRLGFESVDVFGSELQHYTAFQIVVTPREVNQFEDGEIEITGGDIPYEVVRVTLDDYEMDLKVLEAMPGVIRARVPKGLRAGTCSLSINNRRTNGDLVVLSPEWRSLTPEEVPQPWEGFGELELTVRGEGIPEDCEFRIRRMSEGDLSPVEFDLSSEVMPNGNHKLFAGREIEPGAYDLLANQLATGLRVRIKEALPNPEIQEGALARNLISNHQDWYLPIIGKNLHPDMVLDLGEHTPEGFCFAVDHGSQATLRIPPDFPPGSYPIRLNHQETDVILQVISPSWTRLTPSTIPLRRKQTDLVSVVVMGELLPTPGLEDYQLRGRAGGLLDGSVLSIEEVEPEKEHRLTLSPSLARGPATLHFGETDTGLQLRVRRPYPKVMWAAATLAVVGLIVAGFLGLIHILEPRIDLVEFKNAFSGQSAEIQVQGQFLRSLELIDQNEGVVALALDPIEGREQWYGGTSAELQPGVYQMRPRGWLARGDISDLTVKVSDPDYRVFPLELNRFDSVITLSLTTHPDFRLEDGSSFFLRRANDPMLEIPLTLEGQQLTGAFPEGDDNWAGLYTLAREQTPLIAGPSSGKTRGKPLEIRIVEPELISLSTPVIASSDRRIRVDADVENGHSQLRLGVWMGDENSIAWLDSSGAGIFEGAVPQDGIFDLVLGHEEGGWKRSQHSLEIRPAPRILDVQPRKWTPGQTQTLTIRGVNLEGFERIFLKCEASPEQSLEVVMVADEIVRKSEESETFQTRLALGSGEFEVQEAQPAIILSSFDDCLQLLTEFKENGGDPEGLLSCLKNQRPKDEIVLQAADLLFDRQYFAEAKNLYIKRPDLRSQFRAQFVSTLIQGGDPPTLSINESGSEDPYGVAFTRMGWSTREPFEFVESRHLPWELDFVQGYTEPSPRSALRAFERSLEKLSRGKEHAANRPFRLIRDQIALAQLRSAEAAIRGGRWEEAYDRLANELIGEPVNWDSLDAESRSRTYFWLGHLDYWLLGDRDAASRSFESGAAFDANQYPKLCSAYATALSQPSEPRLDERVLALVEDSSWTPSFVALLDLYQHVIGGPHYNVLTGSGKTHSVLSPEEKKRSEWLHLILAYLESHESPADPRAHRVLLYMIRRAQSQTWPQEDGARHAETHLSHLYALMATERERALSDFYVLRGQVEPMRRSEIRILPREKVQSMVDVLENVMSFGLPEPLATEAHSLRSKLSLKGGVSSPASRTTRE